MQNYRKNLIFCYKYIFYSLFLIIVIFFNNNLYSQQLKIKIAVATNSPVSTSIYTNLLKIPMLEIIIYNESTNENIKITALKINAEGTGNDAADISFVYLYKDINKNATNDAGDIQIGSETFSLDNGEVYFTINQTISVGVTNHYLIAYDFSDTGTDPSSYRAVILENSIIAVGSTSGDNVKVSGLPVAGAAKMMGDDETEPRFSIGNPFSLFDPSYAPTNSQISVTVDEKIYTGGIKVITDFSAGYSTNINIIGNKIKIANGMIEAGLDCSTSNLAGNVLSANDTFYDALHTFNNRGVVTEYYVAVDSPGRLDFYIATNAGNSLTYVHSDLNRLILGEDVMYQFAGFSWAVEAGWMIGVHDDGNIPFLGNADIEHYNVSGSSYFLNNTDHNPNPSTFTSQNALLPAIYAKGYAIAEYNTEIFNSSNGSVDYHRIIWRENLNSGIVNAFFGASVNSDMTGAVWVAVSNHQYLSNIPAIQNQQYFQVRFELTANSATYQSPEISYLRILYDITNKPALTVIQTNFFNASTLNKISVYSNGNGNGPFYFTNFLAGNYPGAAYVYGTGFDQYGNYAFNQYIGNFIVDGMIPDITNIQCYRHPNFTERIQNGVTNSDNSVSYRFFATNSISGLRYYYVYTNDLSGTNINYSYENTTNSLFLNQALSPGTNYFIVKALNETGTWGEPYVFTNAYIPPTFYVDIGLNTPDHRYILNTAQNQVLMQIRMQTGTIGYHIFYLKLKANGTIHDQDDFEYKNIRLYVDDGNGLYDDTDTLIKGNINFSADNGYAVFKNFTNTIPANTERYYIIVADFNGSASSDEYFYLSAEGTSILSNIAVDNSATNTYAGLPIFANSNIITYLGTLNLSLGENNPAQSSVNNSDKNINMIQAKLTAGNQENFIVTSISFSGSGSGHEVTNLDNRGVKLIYDANGNGIYDAGDAMVSSGKDYIFDNGNIVFNNLNIPLQKNAVKYLLLTYDFNGSASDGLDFKVSLTSVSGTGEKSQNAINISGTPLTGPKAVIGQDTSGPSFLAGSPFAIPDPTTNTNISIYFTSDEPVYFGGITYKHTNFNEGYGDNLTSDFNSLTITTTSIFAGYTNNYGANIDNTDDRVWMNSAAGRYINENGVITSFIGSIYGAAIFGLFGTIKFRMISNTAGANWTGVGDQYTVEATTGGAAYAVSNVSIPVSKGNAVSIWCVNGNPRGTEGGGSGIDRDGTAGVPDAPVTINFTGRDGNDNLFVGAIGYAVSVYTNLIDLDIVATGESNILNFSWTEELSGGGSITMQVRGTTAGGNIQAAIWYPLTKFSCPNALTNADIRLIEYKATLYAETPDGSTVGPKLTSFSVSVGWENKPNIFSVQNNLTLTNVNSVYIAGSGLSQYHYSNQIFNSNSTISVYGAGRDYYGNWTSNTLILSSNILIGTYLYDNSVPFLSSLLCWATPAHSRPIPGNTVFWDEIVSYTWTNEVSSINTYYYYTLTTNPGLIINDTYPYATNFYKNSVGLPQGTNYFIVRARSGAGNWSSNQIMFTNIYQPATLTLELGENLPAATNILNTASNVSLIQIKLYAGGGSNVYISNVVFNTSGSCEDVSNIQAVRLYNDNNFNGKLDVADNLLGLGLFNSNNGEVTFSDLGYPVPADEYKYWILTIDFNGTAIKNSTISVGIISNSNITAYSADGVKIENLQYFPLWGNTNTLLPSGSLSLLPGNFNTIATNISNDTIDQVMMQFRIYNDENEKARITNISITASGSGDDTLHLVFDSIRLYIDGNNNGLLDISDVQVGVEGNYSTDNGNYIINNLNLVFETNTSTNFIVVQSFNGQALDGDTFRTIVYNTGIKAVGMVSGTSVPINNPSVSGGTMSINYDIAAPNFSSYLSLVSSNPSPDLSNLEIYIDVDEYIFSTNSTGGQVTNYPIVRVVQGVTQKITNMAQWSSGYNGGPFTNIYDVLPGYDGFAEIWVEGFDTATPVSNWTNQLVGTFQVDTIIPTNFITNFTTFSYLNTNYISISGYSLETNIFLSLNIYTSSNAGNIFSFQSNLFLSSSNFSFNNIRISNQHYFTNWAGLYTIDAAGNTNNNERVGLIYTNTQIVLPDFQIFLTNFITFSYTPTNIINISGVTTASNTYLSLQVQSGSNSGNLISYISNYFSESTNFVFTNAILSNQADITNWITIFGTNIYGFQTNSGSSGIILTGIPNIVVYKSNYYIAPVSSGYAGGLNDLVPGTIVEYTLQYSNIGTAIAYSVIFQEYISTNFGFLSNSIIGADSVQFISGADNNYIPSSLVDTNIDKINLIINNISPSAGGSIKFKTVLK